MQTAPTPLKNSQLPPQNVVNPIDGRQEQLQKIRSVLSTNIPPEMQEVPRWVHWSSETKHQGKPPTKVPYDAKDRTRKKKGSSTNPATWTSYSVALDRMTLTRRMGWVLQPPYIGIDIDHCLDDAGEPNPIARAILERFPTTYAEWSPSKHGIHLFLKGNLAQAHKTTHGEIYTSERYFTVTGDILPGRPQSIAYASDVDVQWICQQFEVSTPSRAALHIDHYDIPRWALTGVLPPHIDKVLTQTSTTFQGLWDRSTTPHGPKNDTSDSAYDMAIARIVARAGYDITHVLAVIMCWRTKHGLTKGNKALQITALKAIDLHKEERVLRGDDPPEKMALLKKFLGLDIARLVRLGTTPAQFYMQLAGQPEGIVIGLYEDFLNYKVWERLAFECGGHHLSLEVPGKDKTRWQRYRDLLRVLVEDEPDPTIGTNGETQSWLAGHLTNATMPVGIDAQLLRDGSTFVLPDGAQYMILEQFLQYVQVSCGIRGVSRDTLAVRLKAIGWTSETLHSEDSEGAVSRVYWRST
jgi:hypothetical protein